MYIKFCELCGDSFLVTPENEKKLNTCQWCILSQKFLEFNTKHHNKGCQHSINSDDLLSYSGAISKMKYLNKVCKLINQ